MNDFAATLEVKSDQINAADLAGGSQTIKITRINVNMKADQPVSISYEAAIKFIALARVCAASLLMFGALIQRCILADH